MTIKLADAVRGVGEKLELPDSAVTNSYALLAMKGAGKSNAAVVFAEELYRVGLPWVAVDPKGDWWGIRSGARGGATTGLPVVIFGGLHGDVPIDERAGPTIADLIVDQHVTCVLDTSEMTKAETIRFLTSFFERLYRRKNAATFPLHVFLEECDDYVPQMVRGEISKLVRAVEILVKRGRQRGLGITLISQRSASVNKDVLSQTDTLIALRTTSPHDRKAILAWIDYNAAAREIVDDLPSLGAGEAIVSSPAQLGILKHVKFRRRATFDSGATPELGDRVKPATLADVDLEAVTSALKEQIEESKANDPKLLRARVRELERAVGARAVERPVEVEVEVIREIVPAEVFGALDATLEHYDVAIETLTAARVCVAAALEMVRSQEPAPTSTSRAPAPRPRRERATSPAPAASPAGAGDVRLGKRERAILSVLAQYPDGRTEKQLAMLTGYSARASTIGAGLSALRKAGLVVDRRITDAGIDALGDDYDPLPTGRALLEYWRSKLGNRERLIMDVLIEHAPDSVTGDELAAATGYKPPAESSTIGAGMSALRTLGIAAGWALSSEFAEAIA